MRTKQKQLIAGLSFTFGIAILSFSPYELNAVGSPSVSCEQSIANDNRGLNNNNIQDIGTNAETPLSGISIELSNVDDKEIIKSLNIEYNWTTERVKFRTKPNFNSDVITTISKREKVIVLSKDNKWTKVKYDGEIGYVYSEYLRNKELFTSNKNRWGIDLTNDEIDLLAKIVYLEARGEPNDGQIGVIEVVFNRMKSLDYPDVLIEVLSQGDHFSSWDNRSSANPTDKEYDNIKKVLNGKTSLFDFDVVYFSTSPRNINVAKHIGGHYFCKEDK